MAKKRKRVHPRLDDTMAQGVGNEPQPSNTLPEAVVGQTEQPREGLGQPDEGDFGSGLGEPDESGMSSGIGKVRDGEPMGGTIREHSGQQIGGARNGRGEQRETRESIVDRDRDTADRDKV